MDVLGLGEIHLLGKGEWEVGKEQEDKLVVVAPLHTFNFYLIMTYPL